MVDKYDVGMSGLTEEFERIADYNGWNLEVDESGDYKNIHTSNAFEFFRDGAEWERKELVCDMEEEDLAFMVGADCGPGMLLAMRDKAIAELRSYIKDLEDGNEKR